MYLHKHVSAIKAKFHYAIQVTDLVADLLAHASLLLAS